MADDDYSIEQLWDSIYDELTKSMKKITIIQRLSDNKRSETINLALISIKSSLELLGKFFWLFILMLYFRCCSNELYRPHFERGFPW